MSKLIDNDSVVIATAECLTILGEMLSAERSQVLDHLCEVCGGDPIPYALADQEPILEQPVREIVIGNDDRFKALEALVNEGDGFLARVKAEDGKLTITTADPKECTEIREGIGKDIVELKLRSCKWDENTITFEGAA